LEQICLKCLEKSPEVRYARASELIRALVAYGTSFFSEPSDTTADQDAPKDSGARGEQSAAKKQVPAGSLGSYRLVRRLRAGAFGEVWSAVAPGGIKAAVKVLYRPIDVDAHELKALDLIKNLNHPYLLKTQAWWVEDGRLHIAMELADGSLRGRLKKGRAKGASTVPTVALLAYIREAAEALDYLHGQGLIHRNITPENILLVQGHAKVGDFSLICDADVPGDATAGAVGYMAPECFRAEVSSRSDQYSLAVTYIELRRGRRPFPAHTTLNQAMIDALEGTPDLGNLDQAERKVLLRALAKDAADRYSSCREFADALTAAVPRG
jgi:serine/threonine protein kinase